MIAPHFTGDRPTVKRIYLFAESCHWSHHYICTIWQSVLIDHGRLRMERRISRTRSISGQQQSPAKCKRLSEKSTSDKTSRVRQSYVQVACLRRRQTRMIKVRGLKIWKANRTKLQTQSCHLCCQIDLQGARGFLRVTTLFQTRMPS